jgi:hypothetical protein
MSIGPQPPPYNPSPTPPIIGPYGQPCDVLLYNPGAKQPLSFYSTDRKAASLGNMVQQYVLPRVSPGALLKIGLGTFDFGPNAAGHVILPDHVTIRGMGREKTILTSSIISDTLGCSFALQNTVVEDLTLKNDCWYFAEDGRCVGFDNGAFGLPPGPFNATIRRCNLWCRDWTCYCWSEGNVLTLEDCDITTGRVGVAAENSGNGQDVTLRRCRIFGDASLSNSRGETSNQTNGGCFGVIARSGPVRLYDCEMNLKGRSQADQDANSSWTPRICGVVDRGGGGDAAGRAAIEIMGLKIAINPNGATTFYDLQLEFPYVQDALRCTWSSCLGDGADGGLSKSW